MSHSERMEKLTDGLTKKDEVSVIRELIAALVSYFSESSYEQTVVDDAIQDAAFSTIKKLREDVDQERFGFDSGSKCFSFAKTATFNNLNMSHRRDKTKTKILGELKWVLSNHNKPREISLDIKKYDEEVGLKEFFRAFQKVLTKEEITLVLEKCSGKSYSDIKKLLPQDEATLRVKYSRAIAKLRAELRNKIEWDEFCENFIAIGLPGLYHEYKKAKKETKKKGKSGKTS